MSTDKGATLYTFSYDADGRRTATYFNTVTGNTTWAARTLTSYDKSGRITRITTALNSTPGNLVFDTSYCYSPYVSGQSCPAGSASTDTGLLQYSTDNITGKVSVYSYDKGNRLTNATNVAGHAYGYTYDADGNRTSAKTDGTTTQSLAFNSANQISTSGYAYDGAGNMTAAPGASYSYNAAEEMSSSTVNGTTTPHVYAGGTQRELTSAGTNQFIWGRNDQFGQPWLQSFNTNGGSQVFVERDATGAPLGLHIAGHEYYLVTGNLGSVVAVIDTSGNVAAQYSYDPYGTTVSASETGLGGVPNIVRYVGGLTDLSTGLIKFGQRYYNPALGAFTQQDANQILANPSNGNLYAYAGDSPVNYIDPTGYDVNPGSVGFWAGAWTGAYGCAQGAAGGFQAAVFEGPEAAIGGAVAGCLWNTVATAPISGAVGVLSSVGAEIWNIISAPF
jgi:RHS repeat-associated protein